MKELIKSGELDELFTEEFHLELADGRRAAGGHRVYQGLREDAAEQGVSKEVLQLPATENMGDGAADGLSQACRSSGKSK